MQSIIFFDLPLAGRFRSGYAVLPKTDNLIISPGMYALLSNGTAVKIKRVEALKYEPTEALMKFSVTKLLRPVWIAKE